MDNFIQLLSNNRDVKIQEIFSQNSAAVTIILTAASELADSGNNKAVKALKETLLLSGNMSQSTNQLWREMMKPTYPSKRSWYPASEAEETSR